MVSRFSHAGGYLFYLESHLQEHNHNPKILLRKRLAYLVVLITTALFCIYITPTFINLYIYLLPIQLAPPLIHVGFDTLIWRKKYAN